MIALALTVFTASLVGSLHCAGMCGGFVAFYAGDPAGRMRGAALGGHAAYSAGRLAAYGVLGALAGGLGAALDATGALLGIQRAAAVLAGLLIAAWGLAALSASLGARVPRVSAPLALAGLVSRVLAGLARRPPITRALALGVLTGALPCGWLWAFVVTAAGTGSALGGAALMAVFWAGTLPVMATLGLGLAALAGPFRRYVPAACAVAMIVVGLLALAGRMRPPELHGGGEHRAAPAAHQHEAR
jgi:sulfite exporter TauE/SafE